MILNHLLEIYLLAWISVMLHEMAHYIVAKIINLKVESVHIGDRFFAIHVNKLFISPMIFAGSYLVFDREDLKDKTKKQKIAFFSAGALANLIVALVSVLLRGNNNIYIDIFMWMNLYFFVENIFPFFKHNDAGKLRKYIEKPKRAGRTSRIKEKRAD